MSATRESDVSGDDPYDNMQLKKELQELQKQLREKEKELSGCKDDTKKKLLRDSKEIKLMEKENEDLKTDLENVESGKHSRQDERTMEKLQATLDEGEKVQEEIDQEKLKQEEIQVEIKNMEMKIKDQRRVSAAAGRRGKCGEKAIKSVEGRLEKANRDFSSKLELNKTLRGEIESLRKDFAAFNKMYEKLRDEYGRLKKERDDLIDTTKDIYKQREDASNKCRSLEKKDEEDKVQYELEMQNLQRIITHITNFRNFVNKKCENIDDRRKAAEEERREKVRQRRAQSAKESLEEYEDVFDRIREITQDDDVDVIVEQFLETDSKLYSEFTFVADLESQIGILNNKIIRLKEKNKDIKEISAKEDLEHDEELKGIEERHRQMKELNDELEARAERSVEHMATVLARVEDLYLRIPEKHDALLNLFPSDSEHVTEWNVELYLRQLEIKIDQLTSVSDYMARKNGVTNEERDNIPPPKTPLGFIEYLPDMRSDSDVDDNIDDDAQPLTLEEIRESLLQIEDDSKKHEPVKSPEVPSEVSERDEEIAPLY